MRNLIILLFILPLYNFAQDLKYNGTVKIYSPYDNKLFAKGQMKDSLPTGRWEFYNGNGGIWEIHHYNKGMLDDSFFTYENKRLRCRGFYIDNRRNGKWSYYNERGMSAYNTYKNDTLEGPYYNSNSTLIMKNGRADGPFIKYDAKGKVEIKGQYEKDSREGMWYRGKQQLPYKNNKLNGASRVYWPSDSSLKEEINWKNNKRDGITTHYRQPIVNGKKEGIMIWKTETYSEGQLEGITATYNSKGDTTSIAHYSKGRLTGIQSNKGKNGQLLEWHLHQYTAYGQMDSCLKWDDSGRLICRYVSYSARFYGIRNEKHWDSKGWLSSIDTSYIYGKAICRDIYRYKNGELILEQHWVNRARNGRWFWLKHYDLQYQNDELLTPSETIPDPEWYEDMEPQIAGVEAGSDEEGERFANGIPNRLQYDNSGISLEKCSRKTSSEISSYRLPKVVMNKIDSLGLHGTVTLKVLAFRNGTPGVPIIIQSLHPMADAIAMYLALTQNCSARKQNAIEKAEYIYHTFRF